LINYAFKIYINSIIVYISVEEAKKSEYT